MEVTTMHDFQAKLTSLYNSKLESFKSSQHEHQVADYQPDVIELISKLEIQSVLEVLGIQPHFNVLDIGAGGGRWTLALADKVASITAIEPSALCDLLRSRTKSFSNVHCIHQTFEDFELTQQYDLVIIYGTLMYMPGDQHIQAILSKAAKAVREDGYFVLGEAIARRRKWIADWRNTPKELFESTLPNCQYWEVLRTGEFYSNLCRANYLYLVAKFESHAPLFGRSSLWPVVKSLGWKTIYTYNKACRDLYGMLKYLLDMRRMRIMIWKKPGPIALE